MDWARLGSLLMQQQPPSTDATTGSSGSPYIGPGVINPDLFMFGRMYPDLWGVYGAGRNTVRSPNSTQITPEQMLQYQQQQQLLQPTEDDYARLRSMLRPQYGV